MDEAVFERHQSLSAFPPAKLLYIIYRRLKEHGFHPTWLWIKDKLLRRMRGFSAPEITEVRPGLYVGGQHRQKGLDLMRAEGISAVVNLREESDDIARGVEMERYLWLRTPDDAPISPKDLERGAAFIADQRAAGRGVYVHCASGVGRAPTMAAAYLVSTGMSPEQAWMTIREVRPFIRPTPPQYEVVEAFARLHRAQEGR
ncbi:MAG: protein-tyrosine phosphatase family protein [Anaerolineae bacterium]